MSFYKNIGSSFAELKIKDFEPPYPGGIPECYKHYGENCHLKYYGKDYYFRVRIPEFEKRISSNDVDPKAVKLDGIIHSYLYFSEFMVPKRTVRPISYCDRCTFLNPGKEKSGIHCLLRRGNSQYRCNRCVFMHEAYFEPLDLSKDA